ncbi:MAG: sugar phosphate isomerase/epimerase family protein, partial [Phycisphaerae bacterium]
MYKSINAWTFGPQTSIDEMARISAEAGFEAIELVIDESGPLSFESPQEHCRTLAATVRQRGLRLASLASGVFWRCNFGSPDPATRRRARELTLAGLDRAAWLGAEALLVVPAVVGRANAPQPTTGYADALTRTCQALRELAPAAEDRGVAIAVENVWNRFLLSPVEFRELIDRVNSPWVGVYFDVGNILTIGYPQDWIATLAGRIVRIHVKDYKLPTDGPGSFCPLGDGHVDWSAVMAALAQVG